MPRIESGMPLRVLVFSLLLTLPLFCKTSSISNHLEHLLRSTSGSSAVVCPIYTCTLPSVCEIDPYSIARSFASAVCLAYFLDGVVAGEFFTLRLPLTKLPKEVTEEDWAAAIPSFGYFLYMTELVPWP